MGISTKLIMHENMCVGKLGSSDHVLVLAELDIKTCVAESFQEKTDCKKLIWIEIRIV